MELRFKSRPANVLSMKLEPKIKQKRWDKDLEKQIWDKWQSESMTWVKKIFKE